MKKIGIVGCGAIGSFLALTIAKDFRSEARIIGLCDIDEKSSRLLAGRLRKDVPILSLEILTDRADLVIECTSPQAVPQLVHHVLEKGKDIMVMSVGGLIGNMEIFSLARKKKCRLILPSGAICGLDGLKAASIGRIKKVTLTSRKSPQGLKDAPYIRQNAIDLDSMLQEQVIFEGTSEQAVTGFPKNINVSALLSIAGVGPQETRVKIIAVPGLGVNIHEVEVEGDFGKLMTRTENIPFPENPKTSFLAALSAVATLKQFFDETIRVGT